MNKSDGGPAFPSIYNEGPNALDFCGMSLRDYFAAKAMDACLELERRYPTGNDNQPEYAGAAARAYVFADAMLKVRES